MNLKRLVSNRIFVDCSLIFFSIIVFFRRINALPLRNWDEAWYGEIIKNMASGKYGFLMPYWNGRFYFDNEPLYFWLSTPFYKFFGSGIWEIRFVSALSGVIATYLIYLIGKKLANIQTGIFSALIFLTIGGVVFRLAHGNLDALLICLSLASFYFYIRAQEKFYFNFFSGVSLGLAMLVKSWGIGLFPLFLIASHLIYLNRRKWLNLLIIMCSALVVFSPWYVWGLFKYGGQFANWFILNPSEGRLSSPIANFSFTYINFALRDLGFWLVIPIFFLAIRRAKYFEVRRNFVVPFLAISISYIVFLNFLSDKSDWYLLPAYPVLAIIFGFITTRIFEIEKKHTIVIFVFILVLQCFNVFRIENIYPDRSAVGNNLGMAAYNIIPKEDEVIFDDHDFTGFLYFSDQTHVFTLQDNRKDGEWWILKPEEIRNFIDNNQRTWIITRDKDKFSNFTQVTFFKNYYFLRAN